MKNNEEWKECKLGEIVKLITKGTTPPRGKGFVDEGINYIKSDAINYDGKIDTSKFVAILIKKRIKNLSVHNLKNLIFFSQWLVLILVKMVLF